MVYCPECGRKNPNDARVCGYCGADIRDAAARERDKAEAEKRARGRADKKRETQQNIIKVILVVVVVVGGIIAVTTILPEFFESAKEAMGVCKYDYGIRYTTHIDQYSTSKVGYEFAVVTLRIENNASQSISTNAHNWEMVVDNITYDHSFETYNENIDHTTADIEKGGKITTQIVFEIPQQRSSGPTLKYAGVFLPKLVRDTTLGEKTVNAPLDTLVLSSNEVANSSVTHLTQSGEEHGTSGGKEWYELVYNGDVSSPEAARQDLTRYGSIADADSGLEKIISEFKDGGFCMVGYWEEQLRNITFEEIMVENIGDGTTWMGRGLEWIHTEYLDVEITIYTVVFRVADVTALFAMSDDVGTTFAMTGQTLSKQMVVTRANMLAENIQSGVV